MNSVITTAGPDASGWIVVESINDTGDTSHIPSIFNMEMLEECRICQLDFCYKWCRVKILEE